MNNQRKLVLGASAAIALVAGMMTVSFVHATKHSSAILPMEATGPTTKTISQHVEVKGLAGGLLQPANAQLVNEVMKATVHANGDKTVAIPTDKPIMFFAYWCSHCHDAISQLEQLGYADKVNFVSTQMQLKPTADEFNQGQQLTSQSFTKLGIKEPTNMYYSLPSDPFNSVLTNQPVPFLLVHTKQGWYTFSGAPSDQNVWKTVLQYAAY
ncbi:hypothetical protein [Alicyclobacillus fodiniaquatilis]|uniref:Uncharacterized protein n=1 Tax=Alicyclobacillus fodiniaquatilis TaxID=1661150 RepID=A0ABW4JJN7_9BACL